MKTILKITAGILIAFVLIAVAMVACTGAAVEQVDKEIKKTKQQQQEDTSLPGKKEYAQVKAGMTIKQVNQLLGEPQDTSEAEVDGFKSETITYKARGELGANIVVSFDNGKMSSKAQSGLK